MPLDIAKLFGSGSMGQQLLVWGVLNQVLGTLLQPAMQAILDDVNPKIESGRLSPADAAELVLKGWWELQRGTDEASASGLSGDRFAEMVHNAGEPISPQDALTALRRNILKEDLGKGQGPSFMQAVRESRLRDEWGPVLQALQWVPLPVAEAVDAVVEGQISHSEGERHALIEGVTPEIFQILVNTRGNPPSPTELGELYKRGHIGLSGTGPQQTTFQQGIYEGATKDKWWHLLSDLAEYIPPPRTITALEREGAMTPAMAQHYYQLNGLSAELAGIYSNAATHQKLAKAKELAETTILEMYEAHILDQAQADQGLADLGYTAQEAAWLRALRDMRRSLSALSKAISRISALYIARKITANETTAALSTLGLPPNQVNELMTTWKLERAASVKVLTEGQVAGAFKNGIIDQDTAQRYLEEIGYTPYDAWVLLSIAAKQAQPNPPSDGKNVPGRAQ